jgi:hypothetical protein
MMKKLIINKSIYQLPHLKDLMNDLDNNYKLTNLMTKNVINFNDNKTKICDEKTTKPLQYKQNLLMHHPPLNNAHIQSPPNIPKCTTHPTTELQQF